MTSAARQQTPNPQVRETDWYLSAMERLIHVVQTLSLARDMSSLQCTVRSAARELTGADGATIVLRDGKYCYYADEDAIAPLWKGRRFPMENCISGWVMHNRRPALIEDIYQDDRIPQEAYRPTFVKSMAMVPIRTLDPIGAIGNYWAQTHRPTEREVHILQALADSAAVAVESIGILADLEEHVRQRTRDLQAANEEIRQLSLVDELTGLHNRRGFFLLAEQELKAAARLRMQVFVLFVDADGLKAINDNHGHEAGDEMLRALGRVLKSTFRKSDIVTRLGGDEFCIFGICDTGDSSLAKHRLDAGITDFNASHERPWQLAASSGIHTFPAACGCSLEEAVAQADQAMYAEKTARHAKAKCAAATAGTRRSA